MRRPKFKSLKTSAEGESKNDKNVRDIKTVDKTILDNFYKLVHTQNHIRLKAALSTFKILHAMKKTSPEKFNEHLNYCVERLVTGLASSRADARTGFSMLLMTLLETYQFSTEKLFSIGQKKFGNIAHESKDNLVAYYLLVVIILESGNYKWKSNQSSEHIGKMYQYLKQLKFKKSYFEFPVTSLLVKFYTVFQPFMQTEDVLDNLADPPLTTITSKNNQKRLEKLFYNCSPETLEIYLDKLVSTFDKQHGSDGKKLYPYIAKQMTHLVRRPELIDRHKPTLKLAKFLILNGLFKLVQLHKLPKTFWQEHDVAPAQDLLSVATKASLRAAYHANLDHIVSTCDAQTRLQLLNELLLFIDKLISAGAVEFLEPDEDIAMKWKYYMTAMTNHKNWGVKRGEPKLLFPITSLYLFYGFQIAEHGLECKEQLEELAQSAKEALKNDPSDGSWADVLTDQIIAILSATECNPWIRRLCVSVFGSLLPHISETSIELICDVFRMPAGGVDEGETDGDSEVPVTDDDGGSENSAYEVDMNDEDDNHDISGEASGDDDESDSEDGESSSEHEESRSEKLKADIERSLEIANLSGAVADDDEEEEYLDDEQMMKLDSVIADMFKLNRVGKKKKDFSFQLRCLDLIKKIIQKKSSDVELIRRVLAVIVPFARKCMRNKETRSMAEKINKMIAKMPGKTALKPPQKVDNS